MKKFKIYFCTVLLIGSGLYIFSASNFLSNSINKAMDDFIEETTDHYDKIFGEDDSTTKQEENNVEPQPEPVQQPVQEPVQQPVQEPVQQPVQQPVDNNIQMLVCTSQEKKNGNNMYNHHIVNFTFQNNSCIKYEMINIDRYDDSNIYNQNKSKLTSSKDFVTDDANLTITSYAGDGHDFVNGSEDFYKGKTLEFAKERSEADQASIVTCEVK